MGEALLGIQPPKQAAENGDVSFLSHKFSSHKETGEKGKIQAGRKCTELHSLRKSPAAAGAAQFPAASCPLPRRDLIAEELVGVMNPTGTWSWEAVPCCWGTWGSFLAALKHRAHLTEAEKFAGTWQMEKHPLWGESAARLNFTETGPGVCKRP